MLKEMKTQAHLKPGQKGTKRLVEKYGNALLCVRYRYDETRGVRLKTVEIVVEEKAWPPLVREEESKIVAVVVAYTEKALREALKAAGGRWDPQEKVWRVMHRFGKTDRRTLRGSVSAAVGPLLIPQKFLI